MENSYFIYSDINANINIERFHICTWEFKNNTSFIEFGCEINSISTQNRNNIELELYIPWLTSECIADDFYKKLKGAENSRFIFNDSIQSTDSLDGGANLSGVIHNFSGRNSLCVLPVNLRIDEQRRTVLIDINLNFYNRIENENKPNVYIRFSVVPEKGLIATRKNGITKSTILCDIRINQKRNLPQGLVQVFLNRRLCTVNRCFCFNIVPNNYDLVFFDSSILQNVRTLEFSSFNRYLPDKRIKENELLVVYSRKDDAEAYTFFLIFAKEYIGMDQLAVAVLVSLVSGILLFIPSYRVGYDRNLPYSELWCKMPVFFWVVVALVFIALGYFIWKKLKK